MPHTYENVKTGQDLIDLGVIPKDSSSHLALIAYKRLQVLHNRILASINDEMLGCWKPVIKATYAAADNGIIKEGRAVALNARLGMRVRAIRDYQNRPIGGLEGVIRLVPETRKGADPVRLGIEFDKAFPNGHDLRPQDNQHKVRCPDGHGLYVDAAELEIIDWPHKEYLLDYENALADGVVADSRLGHKVRFTREYQTTLLVDRERRAQIIPPGTHANLLSFDKSKGYLTLEALLTPKRRRKPISCELSVPTDIAVWLLEASSLGQIAPLDKHEEVRKQVMAEFFPRTVIDADLAENVIQMLLMARDINLYGPPGAGKTNIAKDIVAIAQQQGLTFTVDDCKVQCNPFSLFDADFAKTVPPCPECKIRYCPAYQHTGKFLPPKPKDVRVLVCQYEEGKGIEWVEGTTGLKRLHLAGFKMPTLNAGASSVDFENEYDPKGFHPGILPRTNNGVLHLDELDKLLQPTQEGLLSALNSNTMKPDQLRFTYPAHSYVIGTSNDPTKFDLTLIDRMMLQRIDYPSDAEVSAHISRKAFYKEFSPASSVPLGDTHTLQPLDLPRIIVPAPIENAIDAFYLLFRKEYKGEGLNEILAGNRSKFDAFLATRADLLIDRILLPKPPVIAGPEYAMRGIEFAMSSRVQEPNAEALENIERALFDWIEEMYPKTLEKEEDAWWCKFRKHLMVAKTQIPIIQDKFIEETHSYTSRNETLKAFEAVKLAHASPQNRKLQTARINHPFMDYLFKAQPNMALATPAEAATLIAYYVSCDRHGPQCSKK